MYFLPTKNGNAYRFNVSNAAMLLTGLQGANKNLFGPYKNLTHICPAMMKQIQNNNWWQAPNS
jgi:hypothetical protein